MWPAAQDILPSRATVQFIFRLTGEERGRRRRGVETRWERM